MAEQREALRMFRDAVRRTSSNQVEVVERYRQLLEGTGGGEINLPDFVAGSMAVAIESTLRLTQDTLKTHVAFWQLMVGSISRVMSDEVPIRPTPEGSTASTPATPPPAADTAKRHKAT